MAKYLEIALNVPLNQTFTYLNIEPFSESRTGFRAEIKFGRRKTIGYVINEFNSLPEDFPIDEGKIRPVTKFPDEVPFLSKELIDLGKWLSEYYVCSIGEALSIMMPSAKRESSTPGFSVEEEIASSAKIELSDEQKKCVDEILSAGTNSSRLHYLYGATGTGKTEVFLQCAQKILSENKGVIYLVPEISLTQQVIKAVTARFGPTAAVLHSGLTQSQKLREYNRIINREARVVIGARSAVFAPVPDLGLIIIDEEHDSSYKSGSTPRYHGRQAAMYRCSKLKIPLLMGSATPSVEAWHLMEKGKIQKHTLTKRLAGGAMPKIRSINLSNEPSDFLCISKELEKEVNDVLQEKKQVILFLNRRGFTHFYRCRTCGFEMKCKNCSVSMTYHKSDNRLKCHYCGWSSPPPQQCPQCGSLDAGYTGFGTEFIEAEVKAKFPSAKTVRIDTDSVSKASDLQEKLEDFKNGKYDILLGTQMVAKGLNFKNVKLVGVILADTGLHLPDFRSPERTFSLITQVAGRAGRYSPDGKVLVQTYCPDREPVLFAVTGEIQRFYEMELKNREIQNFPPFCRLARLVFRSPTLLQSQKAANGAKEILSKTLKEIYYSNSSTNKELKALKDDAGNCEILGPAECPLSKIAQNYRQQIILKSENIHLLQYLAKKLLYGYTRPQDVYIECDIDPVSLL